MLKSEWQARRVSNPQPAVLETAILPIELLTYSDKPYVNAYNTPNNCIIQVLMQQHPHLLYDHPHGLQIASHLPWRSVKSVLL